MNLNYELEVGFCDPEDSGQFQPINTKYHLNYKGGDNKVKETAAEKKAAEININRWNRSMEKFEPLKQLYREKVDDLDSKGKRSYATGKASQDSLSAFSSAKDRVADSKIRGGINPNSGNFKASLSDISTDQAESGGDGMARAEVSMTESKGRGLMNVLNMGRGEETQAQRGLNYLADTSQKKAISDAQLAEQKRANNLDTAGSVAGLGAYSYNKSQKSDDLAPDWNQPVQDDDDLYWGV